TNHPPDCHPERSEDTSSPSSSEEGRGARDRGSPSHGIVEAVEGAVEVDELLGVGVAGAAEAAEAGEEGGHLRLGQPAPLHHPPLRLLREVHVGEVEAAAEAVEEVAELPRHEPVAVAVLPVQPPYRPHEADERV